MPSQGRPADLAAIRQAVIDRCVPVLMDLRDAAIALDCTEKAAEQRFDNMVMAAGRAGDRVLIRATEVRAALLASRAKPEPASERRCKSCGGPLPRGARRFCSPRCARMTFNQRLQAASESELQDA